DELCSCGQAFSGCPFWRRVGEVAYGGWERVDADELLALERAVLRHRNVPLLLFPERFPGHAERVRRYAEATGRVYAAIAQVAGAETVVDSTKNPPYAYFLRRVPNVKLAVAHLVRDSRGAAFSWAKRVLRPEVRGDRPEYFQEFSPLRAAIRWSECNLSFDLLRRLRTPVVRLRYESLVRSPRGEVERLLRELSLSAPQADLAALDDARVDTRDQHTIRGNPMRFGGAQRVRADDAWRTQMHRGQQRTVLLVTWPLLLRYGYLRGGG
ncbi:MAG TPA: hypothetical protein VMU66_06975, partial [Gaiellales bacterium]|nr:hypothetical protein [Gaiellales bacterium]